MNSPVIIAGLVAGAVALLGLGLGWLGWRRWAMEFERSLFARIEALQHSPPRPEVVEPKAAEPLRIAGSLARTQGLRVDRAEVSRPLPVSSSSTRLEATVDRGVMEPTLIEVPNLALQGSEQVATDSALDMARRFSAIWALEDDGEAPEAIARLLAQPVGQVELVLGLRRQLESGVFASASSVATAAAFPSSTVSKSQSEGRAHE